MSKVCAIPLVIQNLSTGFRFRFTVGSVNETAPDDDVENLDDDDVDIATESEEGELDIPKPLPKVLTLAQKRKKERKDKVLSKRRGPVLREILSPDLEPCKQEVTWNEDPEVICSYNWSSTVDGTNTIYVPGTPTRWTPQDMPYNVRGDAGFHPTDYNYVRQPADPFSAVFNAMTLSNPDLSLKDCDILADRNNLRVLLEVVQGKTVGPFRLDLYVIFNTLIIVRREDGFWRRSDGKSYGFNFEKHFTTPTPDMRDATSHYRAIRYRMGPLRVVCRFEADAYVAIASNVPSESGAAVVPPVPTEPDLMTRPQFSYRAPFKVLQKGVFVPGNQLLELKTQVERPREEGQSNVACLDQLWFGRTTHLYTGRYESGTGKILYIKKEDATERIKNWEERHQDALRKLVGLLAMLRGICKEQEGPTKAVILVREDPRGPLVVHKMQDRRKIVQREFFERHWLAHNRPKRATSRERNLAKGGMRGGRGSGLLAGHRGGYTPRGGATDSDPNNGRLNAEPQPGPRHEASRGAPRVESSHRGRGSAPGSGRGRG
ncbi:uncharacterized protein M421DRAFT_101136 [Didymella exigua CBS 183.55]|uniref:Geranylgeranyl pyrophosphate synthetase n=1 Tax=Didymella exigua CBS 183.55 TaxID=1150837 RepID=A0A6A5RIV2_9PLEO|nr:uncharacterized protein M421DRAFT_101136 [Didymella exigua CBS 183.55]KAF1928301.1 hypothetical protein M421DRAFT_101136 [Didymella exigua CBS 183.55]